MLQYSVQSIEYYECKEWLLYKHYAKRIPNIMYCFGLFNENKILVGVCTFGKPASQYLCNGICGLENSKYVIELNRLITNNDLKKNSLSFFVSKCIKMLPNCIIVSYADKGQNHNGYIYQATNFIYTGCTKERTDINTEDGKHSRHYDKKIDYTKNRKLRTSKNRYVYFNANKKLKKKWLSQLNYKIENYPKEKNKNYKCEYKPNVQTKIF